MDVREKLVELIDDALQRKEGTARVVGKRYVNTIADSLIAHGVTVQEWIPVSEPPKKREHILFAQTKVEFYLDIGTEKNGMLAVEQKSTLHIG